MRLPSLRDRDLLIRTGFTIANVYAFVAAVLVLPFSLAVFVDLTNILFVALLAPLVLSERLTIAKLLAVGLGISGAGIMLSVEAFGLGWVRRASGACDQVRFRCSSDGGQFREYS